MNRAAPVRKRFHPRARTASSGARLGKRHVTHVLNRKHMRSKQTDTERFLVEIDEQKQREG